MVFVLDTGGPLAAIDSSQRFHDATKAALEKATGPLILSSFVPAELDHVLASRVGSESRRVMGQYADLRISLADASNVVLARTGTVRSMSVALGL